LSPPADASRFAEGSLRALLDRHGLRLKRDLGQNYLVQPQQADELAKLAGVGPEDTVIEVGTGLGVLTRALASRARRVRTIEIDSGVVRVLREEALLPENVELTHADALEVDLERWIREAEGTVRVVANLPYSVATPLLRRLLDWRELLADWSVMVQRELAARLTARVGVKDYGSLAVLHALCVDVESMKTLAPGSFFPAPKVHSSFVRVWPRRTPLLSPGELEAVEAVVRPAFQQRRKTVSNALRGAATLLSDLPRDERRALIDAKLAEAGIDARLRPERIEPERWLALARILADAPADPDGGAGA